MWIADGITDLLHVENLPAVGLLLGGIVAIYLLFRNRVIRWGPDVDALLAQLEYRIKERDAAIEELQADRDRWQGVAWQAGHAAQRNAQTTVKAVSTLETVAEKLPGPDN